MSTIFITGASSGIGRATATRFADEGWDVVAAARRFEQGSEPRADPRIRTVRLDVTQPEQVDRVVADVLRETDVDVLFNNAGHLLMGPAEFTTDEQLQHEFEVNLLGPIRVTRAFIPSFRARGGGLVLNTTSMTALVAGPFMSMYGATKAGLERWSFGMNHELNPFGIRVKTIVPGIAGTSLQQHGTTVSGEPYATHMNRIAEGFDRPSLRDTVSDPAETAAVVFEAATDGSDRIRYLTDGVARTQISNLVGYGEERLQTDGTRAMFGV